MITTVSLNPSIDRTLTVEKLCTGGLNRVESQTDVAAGKGANAALAAAALGAEAECIGFMYPDGEGMFRERFRNGGAAASFVMCEGSVRINQKIFDRTRGEITELNGLGAPVTDAQMEAVFDLAARRAARSDWMILTGSLPPGCPADTYQRMCALAKEKGCRVVLDADGERLRAGLRAKPDLIKPNRYELEMLVGRALPDERALIDAARALVDDGIGVAAVSLGGEGALIVCRDGAWRAKPVRVEVKSTVAAGDSMIAGLTVGLQRGLRVPDAFRLGVAAATARCATAPDAGLDARTVDLYASRVEVEKI